MLSVQLVSLEDARRVIAAGDAAANAESQPANIAGVDAGGNLVAHVREDGAWLGSADNSTNKPVTNRALATGATRLGERGRVGQTVLRHTRL